MSTPLEEQCEHCEKQLKLTRVLNENLKQQQKLYSELNILEEAEIKLREKLDEI